MLLFHNDSSKLCWVQNRKYGDNVRRDNDGLWRNGNKPDRVLRSSKTKIRTSLLS